MRGREVGDRRGAGDDVGSLVAAGEEVGGPGLRAGVGGGGAITMNDGRLRFSVPSP